jgi:hypothetical protein
MDAADGIGDGVYLVARLLWGVRDVRISIVQGNLYSNFIFQVPEFISSIPVPLFAIH